jgi:hypothetical protein
MRWISGIQYEGEFVGAILSNYGTLIDENGEKYEGNFYNNYFNGKGIYTYKDGTFYEGEFEFGLMHGKGIYNKKNEFIFEGDWANNMPHGFGKFTVKDFIIKGVWRNGVNVEISEFEKGDQNNFDKNYLNFEVEAFNLLPQMLPNLEKIDDNIKGYGVGTTPTYLNSIE